MIAVTVNGVSTYADRHGVLEAIPFRGFTRYELTMDGRMNRDERA